MITVQILLWMLFSFTHGAPNHAMCTHHVAACHSAPSGRILQPMDGMEGGPA